ncbi:MAG: outer membrane beta-barrel protein, partial [Bacteroidota bacterium]
GDKRFFFEPGLHYYSFTADLVKDPINQEDLSLTDQTTIQSVRMPINIGLNLSGSDALLPIHVRAGIVPSYIIGVNERSEIGFDRDALNDFALAGNVGVGVDIWFLTIKANYEIGLTDFFNDAEGRNNMLTLGLGFKFEI